MLQTPPRAATRSINLGVIAGCALGFASGWNLGNVGAVVSDLARAYDVALSTVGLFTTALFLTHTAAQVPGGKLSDRFGAARAGLLALVLICLGDLVALSGPEPAVVIAARAVTGLGTGLAFIAGSALVRQSGGSPFAQGIFGGMGLASGGVALAVVPQLEGGLGWRAPFWSSLAITVVVLAFVVASRVHRAPRPEHPPRSEGTHTRLLSDRRLYRLAVLYTATYGLSVVVGNWVVELLQRHSTMPDGVAAGVGALTLLMTGVTRPLGGWVLRRHPERTRAVVAGSLVAGALGCTALLVADPPGLAVAGALLVGVGAGMSFAPAFTGAAMARPDAPAAAVGLVNGIANGAILVATPLVGLTFAMAGEGRIGFAIIAALWLGAVALLPSRTMLGVR